MHKGSFSSVLAVPVFRFIIGKALSNPVLQRIDAQSRVNR
jgi:hypothetical protein